METVNELLSIINNGPSTCTASKKDELKVMKALMNDTSYNVDVYGANGKERSFNPSTELRDMCASVFSSAAKISINEAKSLMKDHEFKKSEAEQMIEFSKEFIITYLQTGRKLTLGGRKLSNVSLALKKVPAGERTYPKCIGYDKESGKKIYASGKVYVPAYESVKVYAPNPSWITNKK